MEGHIVVASVDKIAEKEFAFKKITYPALALLVSGGHTQLVLVKEAMRYEIIGNTKDDAVGEAFDKVARMLGLPYPGGPQISKLAEKERTEFPDKKTPYPLPRPMIHSHTIRLLFLGNQDRSAVYLERNSGTDGCDTTRNCERIRGCGDRGYTEKNKGGDGTIRDRNTDHWRRRERQ